MKIKKLTIGGFKNLDDIVLDLDKMVAIVSPNNYGKSNLLEALSFATDFITASIKKRKTMMSWVRGIPLTKTLENKNFKFEMEFETPDIKGYEYVRYGFSFSWYKDDGAGQKILDEWIDMHSTDHNRYASYLKRNEGKYRRGNSTTALRNLKFDDSQLAIDVLSSVSDLEYSEVIEEIRNFEYRICTSLDLHDRFQASPIELVHDEDHTIQFDDEDVPRALYFLKEQYKEKYELFKEAVFNLFPEFYDIDVQMYELKKEDPKIRMYVADNGGQESADPAEIPFHIRDEMYRLIVYSTTLNQPLNISLMSTGTKRIFWLLTNVFVSSCTNVSCIGIEELESSIHPKLLKKLLEVLNETLDDCKLIISSHSPYLIQYLKMDQIYVGNPSCCGVANFKKVKGNSKQKALLDAARGMGMSVGEYIFELLSGGEDSLFFLRKFLGEE